MKKIKCYLNSKGKIMKRIIMKMYAVFMSLSCLVSVIISQNNFSLTEAYGSSETEATVTDLVIPDIENGKEVTSIYIYDRPELETITFPATTEYIQVENCPNVRAYYIDENNENFCSVDGVIYDKKLKTLVLYPMGRTDAIFTVPEGIEAIAESACSFSKFEAIKLPDTLTTIGQNAFAMNTNLKGITIPAAVTAAPFPFYGCSSLESVTFLNDTLEVNSLSSNSNLSGDYYWHIFDGCESSIKVYAPDNKMEEYIETSMFWTLNFELLPLSSKPIENSQSTGISGDSNGDGYCNVADLVVMNHWLLNANTPARSNMNNLTESDMNQDGTIDIFDLVLLRKALITQ